MQLLLIYTQICDTYRKERDILMSKNKRLSVNLPNNLHMYVQQIAKNNNITLSKWMTSAILEKLIRDGEVEVVESSHADEFRFF